MFEVALKDFSSCSSSCWLDRSKAFRVTGNNGMEVLGTQNSDVNIQTFYRVNIALLTSHSSKTFKLYQWPTSFSDEQISAMQRTETQEPVSKGRLQPNRSRSRTDELGRCKLHALTRVFRLFQAFTFHWMHSWVIRRTKA